MGVCLPQEAFQIDVLISAVSCILTSYLSYTVYESGQLAVFCGKSLHGLPKNTKVGNVLSSFQNFLQNQDSGRVGISVTLLVHNKLVEYKQRDEIVNV